MARTAQPQTLRRRAPRAGSSRDDADDRSVDHAFLDEPAYNRRSRSRWPARLLQFGLLLAAVAIVAAIFLARPGTVEDGPISAADILEMTTTGRLSNPTFSGSTPQGEPINLRAAEARPDGLDLNRVELTELEGDVTMEGGRVVTLTAVTGLYDRSQNRVEGGGGVVIATSDGFRFTTESVVALIDQTTATTETPIVGSGPQGEIRAARMTIDWGEGDLIALFEGGVEVTITQIVDSRATGASE